MMSVRGVFTREGAMLAVEKKKRGRERLLDSSGLRRMITRGIMNYCVSCCAGDWSLIDAVGQ